MMSAFEQCSCLTNSHSPIRIECQLYANYISIRTAEKKREKKNQNKSIQPKLCGKNG